MKTNSTRRPAGWASKQGETPFGARLKMERVVRNMTVEELAGFAGLSATAVFSYENERKLPKAESLARLAIVLGCSTDYLLLLEDDQGRPTRDSVPRLR